MPNSKRPLSVATRVLVTRAVPAARRSQTLIEDRRLSARDRATAFEAALVEATRQLRHRRAEVGSATRG